MEQQTGKINVSSSEESARQNKQRVCCQEDLGFSYHCYHLQVLHIRPFCGQQLLGDKVGAVRWEPLQRHQKREWNREHMNSPNMCKYTRPSPQSLRVIQNRLIPILNIDEWLNKWKHHVTNLPPDLVFIICANAAGVVEQRAGEGGRLPAIWTVTAQFQWFLTIDHAVWVISGPRQVRAVGPHSCIQQVKWWEKRKQWVSGINIKSHEETRSGQKHWHPPTS